MAPLTADGSTWHTDDLVNDETWLAGGTFEADFTWRGNRGKLHTPSETLDYGRFAGRFHSLICRINTR